MKKKIFKFELSGGDQLISMPIEAKILCVQLQNNKPVIWVMFDVNQTKTADRIIEVWPTGSEIFTEEFEYVGTYQHDGWVGHVFDGGYARN